MVLQSAADLPIPNCRGQLMDYKKGKAFRFLNAFCVYRGDWCNMKTGRRGHALKGAAILLVAPYGCGLKYCDNIAINTDENGICNALPTKIYRGNVGGDLPDAPPPKAELPAAARRKISI